MTADALQAHNKQEPEYEITPDNWKSIVEKVNRAGLDESRKAEILSMVKRADVSEDDGMPNLRPAPYRKWLQCNPQARPWRVDTWGPRPILESLFDRERDIERQQEEYTNRCLTLHEWAEIAITRGLTPHEWEKLAMEELFTL